MLNTKSNELYQIVTLVRDSFERLAGEASEFVTKDQLNSIMTGRTRINDLYLNNLKTELSSQTAKVNNDLSKLLNEIIDELAKIQLCLRLLEKEKGEIMSIRIITVIVMLGVFPIEGRLILTLIQTRVT